MFQIPPTQQHSAHEIITAATLWMMTRHLQTGCPRLARMIRQHLQWLHVNSPQPHSATYSILVDEWRSLASPSVTPSPSH